MTGQNGACILVIFGATGDLARRKLYPALYALYRDGVLPDRFAVVGVARREKTAEGFRRDIFQAIQQHSRFKVEAGGEWPAFARRFYYLPFNLREGSGYATLKKLLAELDGTYNVPGNRIFYLAVAPENFAPVIDNLAVAGLADNEPPSWQRLMLEKPLGYDLASAETLNRQIRRLFAEEHIYRIDHYLGKEMIQNITVLRLANAFFEPVWNRNYIDNIQINLVETVGVGERSAYYEKAGALRDMVQNHMLQLLTLIAMEHPAGLESAAVRDEKVKVLRSLRPLTEKQVLKDVVRGQYGAGRIDGQKVIGYREEAGVDPASDTETFVAAKVFIDNFRWAGVPFYLRTGKRLAVKGTEIFIQFRSLPEINYFKDYGVLTPNMLVIRVHPLEGVHLQLNVKKPGTGNLIIPITMDFCQNCGMDLNSPEAYERLLYDAMRGDPALFTGWDEVALAWRFIDPIAAVWAQSDVLFPNYVAGSWGPVAAADLLLRDGLRWWPVCGGRQADLPDCWLNAGTPADGFYPGFMKGRAGAETADQPH